MRILTLVFASHREFLSHFSDQYPNGALFCPTKAKVQLRSKVIVDVSLPWLGQPSRLRGQVISLSQGRGMWVHFDRRCRASVDHLKGLTQSEERTSRAHSRYPAALSVRCNIDEANPEMATVDGRIVDLSLGGAFVCGDNVPLVGTRVCLEIGEQGSSARYQIEGRVAWVGTVAEQHGFGVRFDQRGAKSAAPIRTMLRRASEVGELYLD